jgi:phenylacetate-CoA ligase
MALTTSIYEGVPVWLQNALISAYGLRLRRLRYGGDHTRVLNQLRASQWLGPERLRQFQIESLNVLLARARAEVPFYGRRGLAVKRVRSLEELCAIPILSKSEVRDAGREMIAASADRRGLHRVHTGGTTGTPLTIYCDAAGFQRNYAFYSRFREWAGIPAGCAVATFAGRRVVPPGSGPPYWRRNRSANSWLFSSYHIGAQTIPAYVSKLAEVRPVLIDAYPSSLEPIARYIVDHAITHIRPMAVITSSETLKAGVRHVIERAFGCKVFDHYGGAEMAALITQCEQGTYHVNQDFGIVEVIRNGEPVAAGMTGEIVATGFINPVMPLIRYATGDLAVQGLGEPCACGRAFPALQRIEGRMDDVIMTPEGYQVGRLDPVFKVLSTPFETRIVQDAPDHLTIEVVSDRDLPAEEEAAFRSELGARVGRAMRITIQRVEHIPRTAGGKLRSVVRLSDQPDRSQHGPQHL